MAKVSRRYRHPEAEPEHSEKVFSRNLVWLFLLAAVMIVQVATPSGGRLVTMISFLVGLFCWVQLLRSAYFSRIQALWIVPVMCIVVVTCALVAPATSKDVNSYALYGRISAQYHESPYTHMPRDFAADPWFARSSAYWSDTPSVYGPAFSGISDVAMKVSGTSYLKARLCFQLLGAASLLLSVALLSRRIGLPLAAVAVGLNPLLVTFGVNDAHCDVLIGLAVLAGVLAIEKRWWIGAGLALAFAALIKVSLLPALFGAIVWLWFKVGKRAALITAVSGVVPILVGLALTGGLDSVHALSAASLRHTRFSVWNPVHIVLTDIFGSGLPTHTTADTVTSLLAQIAVFGVGLTFLWRNRCNKAPFVAVTAIILSYQVLGAYTLSWYAAWSIPSLALMVPAGKLRDAKPLVIAMAHGCWLAVAYLSGYGVIVVTVVAVAWLIYKYGVPVIGDKWKSSESLPA